jgi:DNA-binding transcriptional MerR regulator
VNAALAAPRAIPENRARMSNRDDAPAEAPGNEYTIDELSTLARVPSRTIRFYQSKGALPSPQIRGRTAYYGPEHVERLKLIGTLSDRGLSIRAIGELLHQVDRGELVLNEWLGLEQQLQEPWANERPRVVTEAELVELVGELRPGVLAELVRLHQIERQGDAYFVHSPGLLQVALRLEAAGIDFETGVGAANILRKHLGRATAELTSFFFRRIGDGFGRDFTPNDLSQAYRALRPLGQESVRIIFAQEMERALRKLIESGATSELPARAKKKKRR